ncbi:MAG: hypothetical protein JSV34_01850 [Candidatus Omnitrophota bacterium]|nr:MAG: hypothetical protein JSV34_01850 [Candidatus Omnitrophota bacterium]
MSIIYEALKKAEEKNKPHYKPKSDFKIIFLIFMVMMGAGIFYVVWKTVSGSDFSPNSKVVYAKKEKKPKTNSLKKAIKKDIGYNLQGIIYDKNEPLAIINGKQIRVGQSIEEALLTQISQEGIEIETSQGKVFISLEE